MKNTYYYIFYRLLVFFRMVSFGTNDIPEWSAMIIFSILIGFNIMTIDGILFLNGSILNVFDTTVATLVGLAIMGFNYFVFIYKNRYMTIEENFSQDKDSQGLNAAIFYVYLIGTIWLMFSVGGQSREIHLKKKADEKRYELPKMPQ